MYEDTAPSLYSAHGASHQYNKPGCPAGTFVVSKQENLRWRGKMDRAKFGPRASVAYCISAQGNLANKVETGVPKQKETPYLSLLTKMDRDVDIL